MAYGLLDELDDILLDETGASLLQELGSLGYELLDELGDDLLDETGDVLLEEYGGVPAPVTVADLFSAGSDSGTSVMSLHVSGTFTGSLFPEGSNDNVTWVGVACYPVGGGAAVTEFTAPGGWTLELSGIMYLRCRQVVTVGTPTILGRTVRGPF